MTRIHPANIKTLDNNPTPGITIACNELGKRFNREWIFRRLNYTFLSGTPYAVTGPNGSGKSTLLQILWGQSPPTTGTLSYAKNGRAVAVEEIFQHIAVATPYMDLIDEFTLQEQLTFHFKLKPARNGMSLEEMLDKMYLTHARHKYIGNFSSGMRQRVKLALAFYTEAAIIFLDEPGTNLDRQAFQWYLTQLQDVPDTTLVLIASNNSEEYPEYTTHLSITDFK